MNKSCARCTKVVYPIEELKCLDKTWHKTCFRCHECGMTLNMKTYKGFNKLPYCEAHIPKAKATAIADTPELKRIAENTKIQSNVKYHADFEKNKGKLTQVADDPETLRIKQNSKIISNVAYHGDLAKKAAMEKQREVAEVADNRDNESEYFSETLAAESLSQYQPQQNQSAAAVPASHHQQDQLDYNNIRNSVVQGSVNPSGGGANAPVNSKASQQLAAQQLQQLYYDQYENYARPTAQNTSIYNNNNINNGLNNNGNHNNNAAMAYNNAHHPGQQQQQHHQQHQQQQQQQYSSGGGGVVAGNNHHHGHTHIPNAYNNSSSSGNYVSTASAAVAANHSNQYNNHMYTDDGHSNSGIVHANPLHASGGSGGGSIGKISDYDPLTDGPRNVPNTTRPSSTLIFSSDRGMVSNNHPRRIGSIADIDPANGVYGSVDHGGYHMQQTQHTHQQMRLAQQSLQQQQQQQQQPNHQSQIAPQKPMQKSISSKVRVFRALYDYEAQDTDEVSFTEGDLIFEVDSIDAGWMTGRVERTGQTGMLPANYVEPAMI